MIKAALIGATGLIGSSLFDLLCEDNYFESITIIVRRPFEIDNPKVIVKVIDFASAAQFSDALEGIDCIFCAVGTTLKKVKGDMAAYRKVDFDIPVDAAKYGKHNGCSQLAVVSSYGADSSKSNFYLKLKGEMEDALSQVELPMLHIFRPSLLLGRRSEKRLLEDVGQSILPLLSLLFPSKAKPIKDKEVAKAMIEAVKGQLSLIGSQTKIYYYNDMVALLK